MAIKGTMRGDAYGCFDRVGEGVMLQVQVEVAKTGATVEAKVVNVTFESSALFYLKGIRVDLPGWEVGVLSHMAEDVDDLLDGVFAPADLSAEGISRAELMAAIKLAIQAEVALR